MEPVDWEFKNSTGETASAPCLCCHLSWLARTAGVAKQGTQLGLWPGVPASPCLLGFLGVRQPHGSGASYWKLMANIKSYPGTLKYSPDTWHAFYQIRSFVVFLEDSKSLSLPMSQVLGGGVTEWMKGQNYLIWSMYVLKAPRFRF